MNIIKDFGTASWRRSGFLLLLFLLPLLYQNCSQYQISQSSYQQLSSENIEAMESGQITNQLAANDFAANEKLISLILPGTVINSKNHIRVASDGSVGIYNFVGQKIQRVISAPPTTKAAQVSSLVEVRIGYPPLPTGWTQTEMESSMSYPQDQICHYLKTDCAGGLVPDPRDPDCGTYEKPQCDQSTVGRPDFFEINGRKMRFVFIPDLKSPEGPPTDMLIQFIKVPPQPLEFPEADSANTVDESESSVPLINEDCPNTNYRITQETVAASFPPNIVSPILNEKAGYFWNAEKLETLSCAELMAKSAQQDYALFPSLNRYIQYKEIEIVTNVDPMVVNIRGGLATIPPNKVMTVCRFNRCGPNKSLAGSAIPLTNSVSDCAPADTVFQQTVNRCPVGYTLKYKPTIENTIKSVASPFLQLLTHDSTNEYFRTILSLPKSSESRVFYCQRDSTLGVCPDDSWILNGSTCYKPKMCTIVDNPPLDQNGESYLEEDSVVQAPQDEDDVPIGAITSDADGNTIITGPPDNSQSFLQKVFDELGNLADGLSHVMNDLGKVLRRESAVGCQGASCTATIGIRG